MVLNIKADFAKETFSNEHVTVQKSWPPPKKKTCKDREPPGAQKEREDEAAAIFIYLFLTK